MSRITEARRSVEDYRSAELITGALQYISAAKMQELRSQFEQNARFFAGINEVYGIVKAHAITQAAVDIEHPEPEGRDIYIGLTSNKRFYGTLNRDIVRSFVGVVGTVKNSDFLMMGLTGVQYLQETSASETVESMVLNDDMPSDADLKKIFALIGAHARVFVVYPKFVNPFRQDVVMTDITQTPTSVFTPEMRADYIFEPEIPGMLAFFEGQVRRAIFERVLLEAELARAAARTMKMHSARDRAGNLKRVFEQSLRHEFETFADIARMESFIGFSSWKL